MMTSIKVYAHLQHLKCFRGVYSKDNIPIIRKYPACYVSNIENSDHIGTHWVAIFQPEREIAYFFDSYGQKPSLYGFKFKGLVYYWKQRVQAKNKSTCGLHSIYFLKRMVLGLPIEYSDNYVFNEKLIKV